MIIRRYLGNNAQEAILKVKMDLGSEALILNTKKVRKKGILNFFSKPMVEVLAAVDSEYALKKNRENEKNVEKQQIFPNDASNKNYFDKKEEKITHLENKVNNIEKMLQKVYQHVQNGDGSINAERQDARAQQANILQLFYNNLLKNDVEAEYAKQVINMVKEKVGSNASVNDAASVLHNVIASIIGKPETIKLREDGKPTVVVFIGPTGVGKTTTLAKIAANFALNQEKKVGLITADTYRIAAVEQLKTYAEILGMPLNVVYSVNEIKEAINSYSDKDIILIDTAGRSHRNKTQFDELKTFVDAAGADEIYLLLSATTSNNNCREIINNYNFLKDYKLIFTKLDEAPVCGMILNVKFMTKKSFSYITNGQSVPDDIEVANVERISKALLGSIV